MLSPTIILSTVYGSVLVNRHDINQTQSLLKNGVAIDHGEIEAVVPLVEPNSVAVDVGACFGLWTLALAQKGATVYSFEVQRPLYNSICGTLALNGIENVFPYNLALGNSNGVIDVPRFDYNKELQFGCVYLGPKTLHGEMVQQPQGVEQAQLATLDSFNLSNVSLIKIDVEGMELDVVNGAKETIKHNRPILYIEIIHGHKEELKSFFISQGYDVLSNHGNILVIPHEKLNSKLTLLREIGTVITPVPARSPDLAGASFYA